MRISSDWHIHTEASCDGACLPMGDLAAQAPRRGITDWGVSDHLHTPYNLPDVEASRRAFDSVTANPRFHFGIEVSCVSVWELAEIRKGRHEKPVYGIRSGGPAGGSLAIGVESGALECYGVEYVVGGTHWPMYVSMERESVIRDYHRQNMFLACHPLVDVVAHPWWWMGHWQDTDGCYTTEPWLDDFGVIPATMHDEFGGAALEHGTKIEINIAAMLLNPNYPERFRREYVEYLAAMGERGVSLSIGSDCHTASYDIDFDAAATMLEGAGIGEHMLWRLEPRTG